MKVYMIPHPQIIKIARCHKIHGMNNSSEHRMEDLRMNVKMGKNVWACM